MKRQKKFTKKNNIYLIEDNAIYFDNYTIKNNKKNHLVIILLLFNIMKNISAMYGGALAINDKKFINYYVNETKKTFTFSN